MASVDGVLVATGPNLEAVLVEVGAHLGPDAEVLDVRREIVGGIAGFFGREQFTVEAVATDVLAASDVPAATEGPALSEVPTSAPAVATVDAGTVDAKPADGTGSDRVATDGASFAAELARALREVERQPLADLLDSASAAAVPECPAAPEVPVAPAAVAPAAPSAEPAAEPAAAVEPTAPVETWDGARGALLALAVQDLSSDDVREHLAELVDDVPGVPNRGVVAVVGDGPDALAVAEALAEDAGIDPQDVLVASAGPCDLRPAWLTVTDPEDGARRAERWHAGTRLTLVAVTMHPGLDGLEWTRSMLAALAADQVRLAVPGWREPEEVVPRLHGLGGVDVIDVCDPVEWPAAAGFLGLPTPVGTIAGLPATIDRWAECLAAGHPVPMSDVDALAQEVAL